MEIARKLDRFHTSVSGRGRRLGLVNAKQSARAAIRHDYFAQIDSPMKAYVLGWLASDGWISRNEICIRLNRKDIEAVKLIRNQLAPLHQVRESNDLAFLRVVSSQIKEDLGRLGVVPRKSLILEYPASLPSKFDNSFILGYFDGNGCLTCTNGRYRWSITAGSDAFLLEVQRRIQDALSIHIGGPGPVAKDSKAQRIWCSLQSDIWITDTWLNSDVKGLERKRYPGPSVLARRKWGVPEG